MPELPEVETVANGLNKRIAGDVFETVWIGDKSNLLKSPADQIIQTLEGSKVARVRRVGKHIVADLSAKKAK
jgi:formamidopyrimidine-DNA glycosylase